MSPTLSSMSKAVPEEVKVERRASREREAEAIRRRRSSMESGEGSGGKQSPVDGAAAAAKGSRTSPPKAAPRYDVAGFWAPVACRAKNGNQAMDCARGWRVASSLSLAPLTQPHTHSHLLRQCITSLPRQSRGYQLTPNHGEE